MNRRDLLKAAVPVAALGMTTVADGIHRVEVPNAPKFFIFFIDRNKVDLVELAQNHTPQYPLMPEGSKGGWLIGVDGDVDGAIRIFALDEEPPKGALPHGAIPLSGV